jgi:uncharacterized MnhB-related membrane protein
MSFKRFLVLLLFCVFSAVLVPVVHAQQDIDFQQIIARLGPSNQMPDLLFDIMRYAMFILAFIALILIPDKQLLASLLMTAVLGMIILAKLEIFDPIDLPTLGLNVGMFVIPLIIAGMLRGRGKTPRALIPSILVGLIGGGYFFLFWAVYQRGTESMPF